MKKFITMIIAAASIFAAVSCNRTFDEKEVPTDGTIYVTRTYKAGLDEATKTTIDAAGKVTWEQGDVIRYYSQKNGEVKEYTIPEGAAHADLTLDVASTASFLIGVYGGTGLTDNLGSSVTIQGAIPAEQTGVFGDHHVAITKTYDVTQQSLTFHNIVSYLKFTLTRTDVAKVVFKANDATQLTGDGIRVSFVSDSEAIDAVAFIGTGSNEIAINNSGAGTFYIATLPCTMAGGFQADCYDATGVYLGSVTTSKSVEVKPGKVLNLGIIDTRMEQIFTDLSAAGTANSYLVSEPGHYKFKANVKGNSTTALDGTPVRARVLWESFGTDETPTVGDIVSGVTFNEGYIQFTSGKNGNAVIAVENRDEDILWSWHIWVCDGYSPAATDQVYNNGAGTIMDRNLGATSATPGDVHALGLLYQWGRKDPFLGGNAISSTTMASSTGTWPAAISIADITGDNSLSFALSNPMTFIFNNESVPFDWYSTDATLSNNELWSEDKSTYDPCPPGYSVPEGGADGVWARAAGTSTTTTVPLFETKISEENGIDFSSSSVGSYALGASSVIWYPSSGSRLYSTGDLFSVGLGGSYWSCSHVGSQSNIFNFRENGYYAPADVSYRVIGRSVRCYKEGSSQPVPEATDLSVSETANSYIVSAAGRYKIKTVKGNTSTSVGNAVSAEVLWESFGNDVSPTVGELVNNVLLDGDYIYFNTSALKGNALIAAKDASGTILWSWHIWLTDQPVDQVYKNGAGTMMDRNLGATSATKGDVKAIGLLYQWGRKDPFPGRRSYAENAGAAVSRTLPSPVDESTVLASNNTSSYAQSHPTTFITSNASNSDWYCNDPAYRNDALWGSTKTVNDPCPKGYRVPDGGPSGLFSTAAGSSANITGAPWDEATSSMDMSSYFGNGIWYPAGVCMLVGDGAYAGPGYGHYFTTTVSGNNVFRLFFSKEGALTVSGTTYRGRGNSVRCYKESSTTSVPVTAISLNKTSASIERGNTLQLTATITPTNATNKTVTWSTSSSTVATVSTSGLVTAKAVGTCTITATSNNGLKATCAVTVIAPGTDLSASGTANSYIVSAAGTYKIKTVKGNSTTSVGTVASASVLWESFGTSTKPAVGDLISGVKVEGNYITFTASAKKGNAVIAAKNSSGTILWSWHIWLTNKPADQVYNNNAGTMMDRNLGATSATPGAVQALGLFYQWGRKDPFLGSSSTTNAVKAQSTNTWPAVQSTSKSGIDMTYAQSHPTTFLTEVARYVSTAGYHESSWPQDDNRWSSTKTINDPCPPGYRVPNGGEQGVWAKALGTSSDIQGLSYWDSTNHGINFGTSPKKLGSSSTIWYPASGYLHYETGELVVGNGAIWSNTPETKQAREFWYVSSYNGHIYPATKSYRGNAFSVRCQKM